MCPNCGTRNEDWVDDKGRYHDELQYEPITHKCFGCDQVEQLKDTLPDDVKGVYVLLSRVNPEGQKNELARRQVEKKKRDLEEGLY